MSEILFRGKRLQGGDWVEGYFYKSDINKRERESGKATLIFTPDCDTFMFIPEAHNSVMVIAETVGQYTGLCDRNGKKIFEGDIVKTKYGRLCEVIWFSIPCAQCWDLIAVEDKHKVPDKSDLWSTKNLEVIGNIYDNPELMGGEAHG